MTDRDSRPARNARIRALVDSLFEPVDAAWLGAFRVFFGLIMTVSALRFVYFGWIDDLLLSPPFHFKYWGFEWIEPLAPDAMHALFWVLAALGVLVAVGVATRVAAFLFTLGFTYVQLIDVTIYLNHYYLASLLGMLLTVAPSERAFSLQSWLSRRRKPATVARGWHVLFRFQVGVVYTFAGIAKLHDDWLLHAQPLDIWLSARTETPLIGPLFRHEFAAPFMSWAGFLYDTTIAWFLLYPRTRPFAFLTVIFFHSVTSSLFPIGMFPVIMVLSALAFFGPSWPRRLVAAVRCRFAKAEPIAPAPSAALAPHTPPGARTRRLVVGTFAAYALVQVLFPMRFLLYGGNVRWHEQGMRFSWRVMVREKNGAITFRVRERATGRTYFVSPSQYLTPLQEREMSGQPDLILQLAHHIRDDFEARGRGPVEVRVDALVSLNGRRSTPLIDPEADLARISDSLAPASWILPAPESPPPRRRTI
ncbi:MAG TPA: HTTM domain-containing protein [Polyangiaceae bacterium]|nr:HTTM domain-containing protein [Polyangiaceae bacterium]